MGKESLKVEHLREQLLIADKQIKRLIRAERQLLDLQEKINRYLKRYQALQEISNFILTTRELEKIFDYVCQRMVIKMDFEKCLILLKRKNKLTVVSLSGYSDKEKEELKNKEFELTFPVIEEILKKNSFLIPLKAGINEEFARKFRIDSLIAFSILGQDKELFGIFLIGNSKEKSFIFPKITEEEFVLFSPLVNQLGIIMELIRLLDTMEEKIKQRTVELEEKIEELERFNKLAVGRELKMVELKEEIGRLKEELNKYRNYE